MQLNITHLFFFFLNDPPPPKTSPLPLPDLLPISRQRTGMCAAEPQGCDFRRVPRGALATSSRPPACDALFGCAIPRVRCATTRRDSGRSARTRSEEHTSELQSPCNLVCRLLLEKK